jgi:ATP-binding protein involved in chromosome partitioning
MPIAGVLENASGYVCPQCGNHADLFGAGGGERLAEEMHIPFLGSIPIDPRVVGCGDRGICLLDSDLDSPVSKRYLELAGSLHEQRDLWSAIPL